MADDLTPTPIADLISSGILAINDGYRAKNSELSRHGLPFARAQNINNGFHFEGADCFPLENIRRVGVKISQPGDVVFTSKGTVGRFAFVGPDTPRFVYAPQLCFWRVLDRERLHPRWLYVCIRPTASSIRDRTWSPCRHRKQGDERWPKDSSGTRRGRPSGGRFWRGRAKAA